MSIKGVKRGDEYHDINYKEFIIEDEDDVADLPNSTTEPPASAGSIAYTQDLAHTYLLGADDVWREV